MRGIFGFLVLTLVLSSLSCETGPQPKASVPATPQPAQAPAPVLEPQTVAQLPTSRPIPPESVPPRPPVAYQTPVAPKEPEVPASDPPLATRQTRIGKSPKRAAKAEAAQPEPPPPVPAQDEPPKPQTLSAVDEQQLSKEQVTGILDQVQQLLKNRPRSEPAATRIRSFVRLSEQSISRGDLRQANILAQRALLLAKDLTLAK